MRWRKWSKDKNRSRKVIFWQQKFSGIAVIMLWEDLRRAWKDLFLSSYIRSPFSLVLFGRLEKWFLVIIVAGNRWANKCEFRYVFGKLYFLKKWNWEKTYSSLQSHVHYIMYAPRQAYIFKTIQQEAHGPSFQPRIFMINGPVLAIISLPSPLPKLYIWFFINHGWEWNPRKPQNMGQA